MALKNCGGLWLKDGKRGKFFSGEFQPEGRGGPSFRIFVFKNDKKEGKQPDYRLVMDDGTDGPRDEIKDSDEENVPF